MFLAAIGGLRAAPLGVDLTFKLMPEPIICAQTDSEDHRLAAFSRNVTNPLK